MLELQNKDAIAVSGSATFRFRDEIALMRMLAIRRMKTFTVAVALIYIGLAVFVLVQDAAKYIGHPGDLVPLTLGFLAWMPIVLGTCFLIATPAIILTLSLAYIGHKRRRRKLGLNPPLDYLINKEGLSLKDYSGSSSFIASSQIARMKIGNNYLIFMFKQGGLRLLPLRGFSDSDIAAVKAIAQNLNGPEPESEAKTASL